MMKETQVFQILVKDYSVGQILTSDQIVPNIEASVFNELIQSFVDRDLLLDDLFPLL